MENIFENAYFGKQYKTKDGRKAVYYHSRADGTHELIVEACGPIITYWPDGDTTHNFTNKRLNIVSEWKEEINEKELEHLSTFYKECHLINGYMDNGIKEAYIAGYRKAKSE